MTKYMIAKISESAAAQQIQERVCELNYERTYSLTSLILFFFSASAVGWIWEVFLHIFIDGAIINRGTMWGPWLPIYGVGGILALVLLKRFSAHPVKIFTLAFFGSAVLEYTTGWALESLRGVKYWDYSQSLFNINGRICLEGLLLFAAGACFIIYAAAPAMDNLYQNISPKTRTILCILLIICFVADAVYSILNPNVGPGITHEVGNTVKFIF